MKISLLQSTTPEVNGKPTARIKSGTLPAFPSNMISNDKKFGTKQIHSAANAEEFPLPSELASADKNVNDAQSDGLVNSILANIGLPVANSPRPQAEQATARADIKEPDAEVSSKAINETNLFVGDETGPGFSFDLLKDSLVSDRPAPPEKPINIQNNNAFKMPPLSEKLHLTQSPKLHGEKDFPKSIDQTHASDIADILGKVTPKSEFNIKENSILAAVKTFSFSQPVQKPEALRSTRVKMDVLDDGVGQSETFGEAEAIISFQTQQNVQLGLKALDSGKLSIRALPANESMFTTLAPLNQHSISSTETMGTIAKPADGVRPLLDNVKIDFDINFIENISREIGALAKQTGVARFSLRPEHLGKIDVEIKNGDGGNEVKLVAETETVRQVLMQSQHRLEQEAKIHGHRLASLDVETNLHQGQEHGNGQTAKPSTERGMQSLADNGSEHTEHITPTTLQKTADHSIRYA